MVATMVRNDMRVVTMLLALLCVHQSFALPIIDTDGLQLTQANESMSGGDGITEERSSRNVRPDRWHETPPASRVQAHARLGGGSAQTTQPASQRRKMQTNGDRLHDEHDVHAEAAHIIKVSTRLVPQASVPAHGRRRTQSGQGCDAGSLPTRVSAVGDACCTSAAGGTGHRRTQADCPLPTVCPSAACAVIFTEFYADCHAILEGLATDFGALYESCGGMQLVSLAQQLGVECVDGTNAADCVPSCDETLHGYLLLLNIDGDDSKLSCEQQKGLFSWVGSAVRTCYPQPSALTADPCRQPCESFNTCS